MALSILCAKCKTTLATPDNAAGRTVKCPKCGALLAVPASAGKTPPSAAVSTKPPIPVASFADPAKGNPAPQYTATIPVARFAGKRSFPVRSLGIASLVVGCLALVTIVIAVFWALLSPNVDKSTKVNQIAEKRDDQSPQVAEPSKKEPTKENGPPIAKKEADKETKQDDPLIAKTEEKKQPKSDPPTVKKEEPKKKVVTNVPPLLGNVFRLSEADLQDEVIRKIEADGTPESTYYGRLLREKKKGRKIEEVAKGSLIKDVLDRYETDPDAPFGTAAADRGKFALIVGMVMRTGTKDGVPYIDICDGSLRATGMRAEFRAFEKMKIAKIKPGNFQLFRDAQGQYRPALAPGADVVTIAGEFAGLTRVEPFVNCICLKECFVITPEFLESTTKRLQKIREDLEKPREIQDEGKFFSEKAVKGANAIVAKIRERHQKHLFIETVEKGPDAKDFDAWTVDRAKKFWVGIYVVMTKDPKGFRVALSEQTRESGLFTISDRDELGKILRGMGEDRDQTLLRIANFTLETMDQRKKLGELEAERKRQEEARLIAEVERMREAAAAEDSKDKTGAKYIRDLRSSDPTVRMTAAIALKNSRAMAKEAVPELVAATCPGANDKFGKSAQIAHDTILSLGIDALHPLIMIVRDDNNPTKKVRALTFLQSIGPVAREAIPVIEGALKDQAQGESVLPDSGDDGRRLPSALTPVKYEAAYALADIAPTNAAVVPVLIEALNYNISHRGMAMLTLKKIGPVAKDALPTLRKLSVAFVPLTNAKQGQASQRLSWQLTHRFWAQEAIRAIAIDEEAK